MATAVPDPDHLEAVRLSEVAPSPPRFLVEPYVPLGAITLLEGDPSAGKSYVAAELAAAVTTGRTPELVRLAGHAHPATKARSVLYVTSEDLPETLRDRFAAQDADLTRAFVVRAALSARDLSPLERLVQRHRPALVVIDPVHALLDGVNMGSANGVRVALAPLAALAADHGFALLAIRHLAKAGGGRAIYRGLGSIDFSAIARSVVRIGEDPERPESRVLVHVKNSLGRLGPSIELEIGERLVWLGRSELSAQDLDARPRRARGRSAVDLAAEFVRAALAGGPLPAAEVRAEAVKAGIPERTLERAQQELGVVHLRVNDRARRGRGTWTWQLPPGDTATGTRTP
ncbi:MAG: AAA family ATPase [Planctomycetota bacterium]|nr:AAA family ATPase [Planctomycetota bacterium]